MEAMSRVWYEVRSLAKDHDAPVLFAGDLFDRWNSPPELINFAMGVLPDEVYAIPGNHDLPSDGLSGVSRSAFHTLVAAGAIHDLHHHSAIIRDYDGGTIRISRMTGETYKVPNELRIALLHEYLWIRGKGYTGAPKEQRLLRSTRRFDGYDIVVVGDNHQGFVFETTNGTTVVNCGTMMRRKSNEASYAPTVWLIHADGSVSPHKLDCSRDELTALEPMQESATMSAVEDFVSDLAGLTEIHLDFRDMVIASMDRANLTPAARKYLMEAMDSGR